VHNPPAPADYNAKILQPLARWLEVHRGENVARAVADRAGIDQSYFTDGNHWIEQRQVEAFLEHARAEMTSDSEFQAAAVHRLGEGYGPIRFVTWATTPTQIYSLAIQTYNLVSRIGEPRLLGSTRTSMQVRFEGGRPISRLNCLLRQAQTADLPTLWGLPRATVHEQACVARGDAYCEYHLRYFTRRSWLPTLVGTATGAAVAFAAMRVGIFETLAVGALPALGAAVGFAFEQQRTGRANLAVFEQQNAALRALAEEDTEARRELLGFHHREREWTRALEREATGRSAAIQSVVERIKRSNEERVRELRGYSHDLRSPLLVIRSGVEYLSGAADRNDATSDQVVEELSDAVERMNRLLQELLDVSARQRPLAPQLAPSALEIEALSERLRRRLRAMVYGRDIRVSVFRTREAPEIIHADGSIVDRITDNVLSNAAKYTERGSIVVELDGSPGYLVVKVSDSGRGIEPESIERAFRPRERQEATHGPDSYGLGLSVVVHLLDQMGGRLEVMSKPNVGTTVWLYLPVKPLQLLTPASNDDADELVRKVVKIRSVKSA